MAGTPVVVRLTLSNDAEQEDETYSFNKTFRLNGLLQSLEEKLAEDGYDDEWGVSRIKLEWNRDEYLDVGLNNVNAKVVNATNLSTLGTTLMSQLIDMAEDKAASDGRPESSPAYYLPDYDDLPNRL